MGSGQHWRCAGFDRRTVGQRGRNRYSSHVECSPLHGGWHHHGSHRRQETETRIGEVARISGIDVTAGRPSNTQWLGTELVTPILIRWLPPCLAGPSWFSSPRAGARHRGSLGRKTTCNNRVTRRTEPSRFRTLDLGTHVQCRGVRPQVQRRRFQAIPPINANIGQAPTGARPVARHPAPPPSASFPVSPSLSSP